MTKFNNNKEIKIKLIKNQIDIKNSFKLLKSYNDVQCYLDDDTENGKTIYIIYAVNKDNKIIKENKGKSMKQSEFQEIVLTTISKINIELNNFKTFVIQQFAEQKKFNEFVTQQFAEQKKFNELFSKRLDSIEYRLTRLESFHQKDIDDYETKK